MKLKTAITSAIMLTITASCGFGQARAITGTGSNNSGINVKPNDETKTVTKKVTTIQFIAVSPKRAWHSSDKSKEPILGELLAFEREAKTGRVSIIRDKKVRLLVGKKDHTLPLEKLSLDDQAYIQNLEESARIAGKLLEPAKAKAKPKPQAKE